MANPIDQYREMKFDDLIQDSGTKFTPAEQERHQIYAGALAAIMRHYWCGNKYGLDVGYPMNPKPDDWPDCKKLGDAYRGHNIAAIAVDHDGLIIDFEFNHNAIFDSSAEHAEARLIRRLFSLSQLSDSWNISSEDNPATRYSTALEKVTVYTSLESCTQCTGIMMLGRVKEVVYLQPDPGMYRIGDLLHTLTVRKPTNDPAAKGKPEPDFIRAPEPISSTRVGLPICADLDAAFGAFLQDAKDKKPFSVKNGKGKPSDSITSFLCTERALKPFADLADKFDKMKLSDAAHKPPVAKMKPDANAGKSKKDDGPLTNEEALDEAKRFVAYAINKGHRATPHR